MSSTSESDNSAVRKENKEGEVGSGTDDEGESEVDEDEDEKEREKEKVVEKRREVSISSVPDSSRGGKTLETSEDMDVDEEEASLLAEQAKTEAALAAIREYFLYFYFHSID